MLLTADTTKKEKLNAVLMMWSNNLKKEGPTRACRYSSRANLEL